MRNDRIIFIILGCLTEDSYVS